MEDRKIVFDVDEVFMESMKELGTSVNNHEPLMTEETFRRISEMSPAELERLIDDLEKKHRGFRNLIGKRGANGFQFHENGHELSLREGTPKGSIQSVSSILIDDSKNICEEYESGRKL